MSLFFHGWAVSDYLRNVEGNFHLEYVDEDDVVITLMERMKKHNISSVPVRDPKANKFIGIVDVLDLVTFSIAKFSTIPVQAYESYQQMESFAKTHVKFLLDISGRNRFVTIHERRSLSDLVLMLSDRHTHRVAIVNDNNNVAGIVSQSAVVRFFYSQRSKFDERFKRVLNEKVEDWTHVHQQKLYTISMNEHVYDAFRKIWEMQVTGLAVVNDQGNLVANISASDIKRTRYYPIIGQMVKDLYKPIKEFLKIPEAGQLMKKKEHIAFFVHQGDTMEKAMETLVENNIHRVFVVDNHRKPIAVISLCDILRKLYQTA